MTNFKDTIINFILMLIQVVLVVYLKLMKEEWVHTKLLVLMV